MASTAMNTRKRVTPLISTSEPEPCVGGALVNGSDGIIDQSAPEALDQRAAGTVAAEADLFAETLLHHRHKMADSIGEADLDRFLTDPDLAGEQIGVIREFLATAGFDVADEEIVQLFEPALEPLHIRRFLRLEGIKKAFRFACGMDAALDAVAFDQVVRAEACGNDADGAQLLCRKQAGSE